MKRSSLVERQILKAQAEGQLDNLAGAGKPLENDAASSSLEAIGFRIMAAAGAVPRGVEVRRQVAEQARVLTEAVGDEVRNARWRNSRTSNFARH